MPENTQVFNLPSFAVFVTQVKPLLLEIRKFAVTKHTTPRQLTDSLGMAIGYFYHAREILAKAEYFLILAKRFKLPPKEEGVTALEREVVMDANVADETLFRDLADATVDAIKEKISTSQTLLNVLRNETKFPRAPEP